MPTAEQIRGAVEAYVDSFVARDKGTFLAALAEDVEQIDPVGSAPNRGKDALGRFWDGVFETCERLEFQVRDLVVAGDEAALVFTIVQHFRAGGGLVIDGVDVFRIDGDGKIAQVKGYADEGHIRPLA